MKSKISITINQKTLNQIKNMIDGVNITGVSQAIESLVEKALEEKKTAIIIAVEPKGFNQRKGEIKPLIKIQGKPIISHTIKKLVENNFNKIFIVGSHFTLKAIFDAVGDGSAMGAEVDYVHEEFAHGSLGVKTLKGTISSHFLVVYCDIIFNKVDLEDFWKHHLQSKGLATLLLSPQKPLVSQKEFGVKLRGRQIVDIHKRKENDPLLYFMGVFAAEPEFLDVAYKYDEMLVNLSKKGLLEGYVESVPYIHIHSQKETSELSKKELDAAI